MRKDSGIKTVADLKGKTIALSSKRGMIATITVTYILMQNGLSPADYTVVTARNPPNAVLSAFYKKVDAGGAGNIVLDLPVMKKQVDVSQLTLLAVSKPLAHVPWAVRDDMPEDLAKQITSLLAGLSASPDGMKILKQAKVNALVPAEDRDYDPHRKIVKAVLGEEY